MRQIDAIGSYIVAAGWIYKGSCNCGGMLTYKYELKTMAGEYKLRARSTSFSISRPGERFTKLNISELKRILNEVNANAAQSTTSQTKI